MARKKGPGCLFLIKQQIWKFRLFVRSHPIISLAVLILGVYVTLTAHTTTVPDQIHLLENVAQSSQSDVKAQAKPKPTFPSKLKARQMWEDIQQEKQSVSDKESTKGPLELNSAGYCVHAYGGEKIPKDGTKLIVYEQCLGEERLKWSFLADGRWLHVLSGKCVEVKGDELFLQQDCGARFSLSGGQITHVSSGKCVSSKPRKDHPVSVADSCLHSHWALASSPHNARKDLPTPQFVKERVRKVAISTLISQDPGSSSGFLDSAGSLVMSIREANLSYDYDLIAIVSKKVVKARPILEKLGFIIMEKELPMQPEEIRNEKVREEMLNDGCCGMDELLKLHAWKLFEYDRVLQIDADILFHKNFDELFEYDATLSWTHGALGGSEPLNGGFLVIRPDLDDYNEMVEIIKEGDFQGGKGWRGVCCWVYGGRTIQGILPYFYIHHKKVRHQELERCQYNNMVEIDRCKTWNYNHVTSNHFTVCQKPFTCREYVARRSPLCANFTKRWWEMSHKLEAELGLKQRPECLRGRYTPIKWEDAEALSWD